MYIYMYAAFSYVALYGSILYQTEFVERSEMI